MAQSASVFTQDFLNWYTPVALKNNVTPTWDSALRLKGSYFSPELRHALRRDITAQSNAAEIVGLDFDPFLASQDPEERYEVGKTSQVAATWRVEIFGVRFGKRNKKPDLVAELAQMNGSWQFVNFHYPDGGDLLNLLKANEEDRQKHPPLLRK
jgi:hypothetical protein